MQKSPSRLAILISGYGSNLQAIIDAVQSGQIPANIAVVVSNKANAYGLERAKKAGIPSEVVASKGISNRQTYDNMLSDVIDKYQPDLLILAGFMRILSKEFVLKYQGKLINIHPSLLPKYKGLNTHAKVLAAGDKIHGVCVHYVTPDLDSGPIIGQAQLTVLPNDTVESLEQRIRALEHKLYPEVIAKLIGSK